MTDGSSAKRFAFGLGSLTIGSLIYLVARPPWQAPLLTHLLPLPNPPAPMIYGIPIINNLPSFLHTFAFILLLTSVAGSDRRSYSMVCFLWVCVEIVFELFQSSTANTWMQLHGIHTPKGDAFSDAIVGACVRGTFDVADLVAITLGGMAAYALLSNSNKRGKV